MRLLANWAMPSSIRWIWKKNSPWNFRFYCLDLIWFYSKTLKISQKRMEGPFNITSIFKSGMEYLIHHFDSFIHICGHSLSYLSIITTTSRNHIIKTSIWSLIRSSWKLPFDRQLFNCKIFVQLFDVFIELLNTLIHTLSIKSGIIIKTISIFTT